MTNTSERYLASFHKTIWVVAMEINFKNETNKERVQNSRLSVIFSPALFYRLRIVSFHSNFVLTIKF